MHEPFTENSPTKHAGQPRGSLLELTLLFLRLGSTAIGGPAVHIAMMEEGVVTRRGWLTRAEFLDFLGATNLIPGPNSTEMAIHVGRVQAGWRGLLVAGVSFILPGALMVGCLAWAYVRCGALPQIAALLYGVKPVVIVVIAQGRCSWEGRRSSPRDWQCWAFWRWSRRRWASMRCWCCLRPGHWRGWCICGRGFGATTWRRERWVSGAEWQRPQRGSSRSASRCCFWCC